VSTIVPESTNSPIIENMIDLDISRNHWPSPNAASELDFVDACQLHAAAFGASLLC
jgi:hypothetical protein